MPPFDMSGAVDAVGEGLGKSLGFDAGEAVEEEVVSTTSEEAGTEVQESATAETEAAPAQEEAPSSEAPKQEEAPTDAPAVTAPKTWRPEAAAEFAKLPPVVQQEVLKREEDVFRGLEQYKGMANVGKAYDSVITPYKDIFRQLNVDPVQQVKGLMEAHYTLAFGSPEAKSSLFQRLAQDYGVNLAELQEQATYVDPQVTALQQRLQSLESTLKAVKGAEEHRTVETLQASIRAFETDPKNVYFKEVAQDMATLLQSGVEETLEGAYQAAIWRNPSVRAREIERVAKEKQAAAAKAAADHAANARKAQAANVRSSARSGSAATPTGSMEDTMKETLAKLRASDN